MLSSTKAQNELREYEPRKSGEKENIYWRMAMRVYVRWKVKGIMQNEATRVEIVENSD